MIAYRRDPDIAAADLADLYRDAGLRRPVDDLPRMARMLRHANLVYAAYDGERLIGVARALTDFSHCCYLADLAVRQAQQRAGIARRLLELVRQAIGEECMLLLLSARGAMEYYPRVGFRAVDNGFVIDRVR